MRRLVRGGTRGRLLVLLSAVLIAACAPVAAPPAASPAGAAPTGASAASGASAAAPAPAPAASPIKLNASFSSRSGNSTGLYVAMERGYFAEHGLDVDL